MKSSIFWGKAYSEFPLLFFIPGLIVGQYFGELLNGVALCLIIPGCIGLLCLRLFRARAFFGGTLVSLIVGMATSLLAQGAELPPSLVGEGRYLARVLNTPSFPKAGGTKVPLELESRLAHESSEVLNRVHLLCDGPDLPWLNTSKLTAGDEAIFYIDVRPVPLEVNPFQYGALLRRRGYSGTCRLKFVAPLLRQDFGESVAIGPWLRERLERKFGEREEIRLFESMLIGTRDILTRNTEESFQRTGLTHLLVFSGFQVTLLYGGLFFISRLVLLRLPLQCSIRSAGPISALLGTFCLLSLRGFDESSVRAVVALLIAGSSMIWERGRAGILHASTVSLIGVSILWPGAIFEPGAQLTFAALIGISIGISDPSPSKIRKYLSISLSVSMITSIVVVLWFNQLSLSGVILNPILAPLVSSLVCHGGLVALFMYFSGIDPNGVLIQLILWSLKVFLQFVGLVGGLDLGTLVLEDAREKYGVAATLFLLCSILVRSRIRYYRAQIGY